MQRQAGRQARSAGNRTNDTENFPRPLLHVIADGTARAIHHRTYAIIGRAVRGPSPRYTLHISRRDSAVLESPHFRSVTTSAVRADRASLSSFFLSGARVVRQVLLCHLSSFPCFFLLFLPAPLVALKQNIGRSRRKWCMMLRKSRIPRSRELVMIMRAADLFRPSRPSRSRD